MKGRLVGGRGDTATIWGTALKCRTEVKIGAGAEIEKGQVGANQRDTGRCLLASVQASWIYLKMLIFRVLEHG